MSFETECESFLASPTKLSFEEARRIGKEAGAKVSTGSFRAKSSRVDLRNCGDREISRDATEEKFASRFIIPFELPPCISLRLTLGDLQFATEFGMEFHLRLRNSRRRD